MKKIFRNFFGGSGGTTKVRQVKLATYHQPEVLQRKMTEAGMSHGQEVEATLSNVRVTTEEGVPRLYFCPMREVSVLKNITWGDKKPIPGTIELKSDLAVEGVVDDGFYNLKNVLLTSNGSIQITATENTRLELVSMA